MAVRAIVVLMVATGLSCIDDERCDISCPEDRPVPVSGLSCYCVECRSDVHCPDTRPICGRANSKCYECAEDTDCAAPTPACRGGTCAECHGDLDCPNDRPFCGTFGTCFECGSRLLYEGGLLEPSYYRHYYCPPEMPICDDGTCTACTNHLQCRDEQLAYYGPEGWHDRFVCLQATGQCVACSIPSSCLDCDWLNRWCFLP